MAHKMKGYGMKAMPKKMKMAGYAKSEGAGTRPGENAYVERRKVSKAPYVPK